MCLNGRQKVILGEGKSERRYAIRTVRYPGGVGAQVGEGVNSEEGSIKKKKPFFFLENKSLQHNTDLFFVYHIVFEQCFKLVQILKGATEDYFSQGTCILGTVLCATLAMTSHIQQIIMIINNDVKNEYSVRNSTGT